MWLTPRRVFAHELLVGRSDLGLFDTVFHVWLTPRRVFAHELLVGRSDLGLYDTVFHVWLTLGRVFGRYPLVPILFMIPEREEGML